MHELQELLDNLMKKRGRLLFLLALDEALNDRLTIEVPELSKQLLQELERALTESINKKQRILLKIMEERMNVRDNM